MRYKASSEAEKCHERFWVFISEKLFRYNSLDPFLLPPTDGTQYPPMNHHAPWLLFFLWFSWNTSRKIIHISGAGLHYNFGK